MKSRACLGILLLALAGLACNLSAALTPATASPTHSPASGLRPAGSTPLSPTAPAPTTVPTATPGQPTPLPEVEFEPAGATVESELGRPRLSGVPEVLDTAHFRVHYTIKGVDAVPGADADGDGHPDYVEEVARALEYARLVQIDTLGWAPPPPDGSEGGDERYDVYLQDILVDGTAGYTDGGYAQTMVGDNPFTEAVETRSSRSFVVLDNDYAELDAWGDEEITSLALMQSTAAHEYHHALQYGYDAEEPAAWLWEAGATWMQEKVFDDINDAVAELPSVFKSPDTCQLSEGRERVESDGHWYGLWIFLQYVAEQHGADAVRAIWEQARTLDGYAAIEAALAAYGADLDGALHGFHLALLTRDFEEGAGFPVLRLEGVAGAAGEFVPGDGVGQMAADYIAIEASGPVTVQLVGNGMRGTLAGIQSGELHAFAMDTGAATVDASRYEYMYLIVENPARAQDEADCAFAGYTVALSEGGQPSDPDSVLSAPNFMPPRFETLADVQGYYTPGEPVAAPPELIPAYLPPGYVFGESYLLEKDDFGPPEDAVWYVPGDGPATVLDYYGDGDAFISLTASDSPYEALDAWLAQVDYDPTLEEDVQIAGVRVILFDLSTPAEPYTSATFLHEGRFVVLEGTIGVTEMRRVVASLLRGKARRMQQIITGRARTGIYTPIFT